MHAQADPEFFVFRVMAVAQAVDRRSGQRSQPFGFEHVGHAAALQVIGLQVQAVTLAQGQILCVEGQRIGRDTVVDGIHAVDRVVRHLDVGIVLIDAGTVFAFDIAGGERDSIKVFIRRFEGLDIAQPDGRQASDMDVALDHEREVAVIVDINLVGIDAGGSGEQRGGQGRGTEKEFHSHQNFRLRLMYGIGQAKTESM